MANDTRNDDCRMIEINANDTRIAILDCLRIS